MWGDQQIYTCGGFLNDFALAVRLEDDCDVHMKTGSEHAIPLLWSRDMGRGRIVVNNNTLVQNKDGRGQATAALFALEEYTLAAAYVRGVAEELGIAICQPV